MARTSLASLIDELGDVKSQIDELKARESELREKILASGKGEAHGKRFQFKVTHSQYTSVDYKGLLEKLNPSPQLLTAYTTIQERVTLRISVYQP